MTDTLRTAASIVAKAFLRGIGYQFARRLVWWR